MLKDEEPPTPSGPVVVEGAGDQSPTSPDAVTTVEVDVGWAVTLKIVESARNESERGMQADPDGGIDLGDVDDVVVDRTT